MSCYKANNCKKYKMNIGNPNDWENPCNHCPYNISDYEIGYNKAIDDFVKLVHKHDWNIRNINENSFIYGAIDTLAEQLKERR